MLKNKDQRLPYNAVLGVESWIVETLHLYNYDEDDGYCVNDVLCHYQLVHGGA